MDYQVTALLRETLGNALSLSDALRSLSNSDKVAVALLELLERDIARLSSAMDSNTRQTILLALAFPSLDGRAADALGGIDIETNPVTEKSYHLLNRSLIDAIDAVSGSTH